MSLDNSVTFTDACVRDFNAEAKQIWKTLDKSGDNALDIHEIRDWILQHDTALDKSSMEDLDVAIQRSFKDIDKDGSGSLNYSEFVKFYRLLEAEKQQMLHASRHHITVLPHSVEKFNKKSFTTEAIEKQLQDKVQQHTSQDSDRFRQILCMFKTQVQRAHDHDNVGSEVMGVTKRQFKTVLMWLGLFATEQQASILFDKYDINGDGILTVHEFLTKARPQDYPGRTVNSGERYSFRTGKRMYLEDTLNGRAVRPTTPLEDVCHVSCETVAERIRDRMSNSPGVSQHYGETPNALRDLMKVFKFYDRKRTGYCDPRCIKLALKDLRLAFGESHLELLMDRFGHEAGFHYPSFVQFVYPGKPSYAALPMHTSLQLRKHKPATLDFGSTLPSQRSRSRAPTPALSGRRGDSLSLAGSASMARLTPLHVSVPGSARKSLSRSNSVRGLSRPGSQQFNARATAPMMRA
jgi:Ca2+-binding EF-hand superfamily protein